ncbi:MAG: glycosyltransferase [Lachnospiraceae bacterium]|nr:glycosyltransferase [Lachnospiraceae bacterium]
MKKVLFVIRELSGGGAERALSNIMENFPADWEMDILMNNREYIDFPCKANVLSLDIPEPKNRNAISYQIWMIIKRTWYLRKLKKENHYVASVSFLDTSNISNVLSGNKHCKTIISVRNMLTKQSGMPVRICTYLLMRMLYCHADKIVAVSREIGGDIHRRYHIKEDKITAIVNGYDSEKIDQDASKELQDTQEAALFATHPVIVAVGRLTQQKGQWHLIRAFQKVVEQIPEARLYLLGSGDMQEYLEKLIQNLGLQEKVKLNGFANNPFQYIRNAACYVMPSLYEGYPNALAEAVCCDAACIAADFHSGAREILAPQMDVLGERTREMTEMSYGILTPICSGRRYEGQEPLEHAEQCLADAMVEMLQNGEKRRYYQNQSKIRKEDLDIKTVVQKWVDTITE